MHKYKMRYKLQIEDCEEGYSVEDRTQEQGLTDGLFVVSMLYPEDGSYSQKIIMAYNGKKHDAMTEGEVFKLWMTMGLGLADNSEIDGIYRTILDAFQKMVRQIWK